MTDRHLQSLPHAPTPITSSAEATQTLDDGPFVAYALLQAFALFAALVKKRWPQLR